MTLYCVMVFIVIFICVGAIINVGDNCEMRILIVIGPSFLAIN